ncbi:MAG: RNA 2'-phosphotransferase [Paludibaculum sp.]
MPPPHNSALSKVVSHALRHAPEEYHLQLDPEGWVAVDALVGALRKRAEWNSSDEGELRAMIESSPKRRHEMANGRIRALYGHSVPEAVERVPLRPPDVLYHGTANAVLTSILSEGLRPMGRQHVHLSLDVETAELAGRRKDARPAILLVDAARAYDSGITFYQGNESVWLAGQVPAEYLSVFLC